MEKNINVSEQDIWSILEQEGLSKYLGITKDEFYFLISLHHQNLSEDELKSHLLAYRNYQKYRNLENNNIELNDNKQK